MIINKQGGDRLTSQRQIITSYLRSVKTHPSVEVIYQEVKKKLPRISLGTVYRNLKNLREKGAIREISTEVKRFDGNVAQHHHFLCQNCQRIFDIEVNLASPIKKKKIAQVGIIKNYQLYFSGICHFCQKGGKR